MLRQQYSELLLTLLIFLYNRDPLFFFKLQEIHQKILQQKHHVTLLQEETDCPDVDELNKQLKCVTDLFNKKKHVFQDHFIGVLNRK